jgi:hypothetical protein
MKPGETIRIACGECNIVFDLCVAPPSEWGEDFDSSTDTVNDIEPTCCPFCGAAAGELKDLHDRATRAGQGV